MATEENLISLHTMDYFNDEDDEYITLSSTADETLDVEEPTPIIITSSTSDYSEHLTNINNQLIACNTLLFTIIFFGIMKVVYNTINKSF